VGVWGAIRRGCGGARWVPKDPREELGAFDSIDERWVPDSRRVLNGSTSRNI
jgi:hypothetical protein